MASRAMARVASRLGLRPSNKRPVRVCDRRESPSKIPTYALWVPTLSLATASVPPLALVPRQNTHILVAASGEVHHQYVMGRNVGASRSASATACALSSAGKIPSVRASLTTASSAAASSCDDTPRVPSRAAPRAPAQSTHNPAPQKPSASAQSARSHPAKRTNTSPAKPPAPRL